MSVLLSILRIVQRRETLGASKFLNFAYLSYLYLPRTVFDTVCESSRDVREVLDDVVSCETVQRQVCKTVQNGERTGHDCEWLPHEKCSVGQQSVEKQSPKVQCKQIRREMCSDGCAIKEVSSHLTV